MKSKIEKLNIFADELSGKDYVKVLGIANKVDEIIDWINSQDQGEEKECECCKWDDMGYTHEPYCPLFKEYKQDTPEEKEELTKEEWFMLKLAVNEIHNKGNGAYDEISRKIDRLSKLTTK